MRAVYRGILLAVGINGILRYIINITTAHGGRYSVHAIYRITAVYWRYMLIRYTTLVMAYHELIVQYIATLLCCMYRTLC
jgi:hypothetical protein